MNIEKTPQDLLRGWAAAYRGGPPELRFPSDPHAEFFPVDMDMAAAEMDRMKAALLDIVRRGTWTGTDGCTYTSAECRAAKEALGIRDD